MVALEIMCRSYLLEIRVVYFLDGRKGDYPANIYEDLLHDKALHLLRDTPHDSPTKPAIYGLYHRTSVTHDSETYL